MEINNGPSIQTQVEVLKQAENVQAQTVSKLLDDSAQQLQDQEQAVQETHQESTAQLTGLGTGLDISA